MANDPQGAAGARERHIHAPHIRQKADALRKGNSSWTLIMYASVAQPIIICVSVKSRSQPRHASTFNFDHTGLSLSTPDFARTQEKMTTSASRPCSTFTSLHMNEVVAGSRVVARRIGAGKGALEWPATIHLHAAIFDGDAMCCAHTWKPSTVANSTLSSSRTDCVWRALQGKI